ncbi:hypothetical protein KV557_09520 [Kitasatospora aureofaciens]|uniref:hypothetical protein n=1 Tax=Kitasatospora aureofaciens TaxID=1894 RepID=UPI001C4556B7|nr:hypothetical protein [Kitasatospora aureofaciens]MBV6697361.1 hypothetical protein [Kitasatospora aureofaciens]
MLIPGSRPRNSPYAAGPYINSRSTSIVHHPATAASVSSAGHPASGRAVQHQLGVPFPPATLRLVTHAAPAFTTR